MIFVYVSRRRLTTHTMDGAECDDSVRGSLIHPFISDDLCIAKNYPYVVTHLLLLYALFDLCTLL